jgi:hypothetical protein
VCPVCEKTGIPEVRSAGLPVCSHCGEQVQPESERVEDAESAERWAKAFRTSLRNGGSVVETLGRETVGYIARALETGAAALRSVPTLRAENATLRERYDEAVASLTRSRLESESLRERVRLEAAVLDQRMMQVRELEMERDALRERVQGVLEMAEEASERTVYGIDSRDSFFDALTRIHRIRDALARALPPQRGRGRRRGMSYLGVDPGEREDTPRPVVYGFFARREGGRMYARAVWYDGQHARTLGEHWSTLLMYLPKDLERRMRLMHAAEMAASDFRWVPDLSRNNEALSACIAANDAERDRRTADAARALLGEEVEV